MISNPTVGIIDYKINNIASVKNALNQIKFKNIVLDHKNVKKKIKNCDSLILPGIGSYSEAMKILKKTSLDEAIINHTIDKKVPILGICLGMQLLVNGSEEFGYTEGLGLIPGKVKKLKTKNLRVPNVGWNEIKIKKRNNLMENFLIKKPYFYHVHSYYVSCQKKYKIAEIDYDQNVTVAINHKNIFGVQFHPERSHKNGLQLLINFKKISGHLHDK